MKPNKSITQQLNLPLSQVVGVLLRSLRNEWFHETEYLKIDYRWAVSVSFSMTVPTGTSLPVLCTARRNRQEMVTPSAVWRVRRRGRTSSVLRRVSRTSDSTPVISALNIEHSGKLRPKNKKQKKSCRRVANKLAIRDYRKEVSARLGRVQKRENIDQPVSDSLARSLFDLAATRGYRSWSRWVMSSHLRHAGMMYNCLCMLR